MIIRFTSEDRNVSLSARSSAFMQGLTAWCSVSIAAHWRRWRLRKVTKSEEFPNE